MALPRFRLLRPRSWPIALKMSADLLLAAMVPLGVAVAISAWQTGRELEGAARANLQLLARVTASRLDQLLEDTSRATRQVALDAAVIDRCESGMPPAATEAAAADVAVMRRLEAVVRTNPDFASIFITNAAGLGLCSTNARNVGMDLNFREYFQRARAGENYVSEVLIGKTSHEPGVYFSTPVRAAPVTPATEGSPAEPGPVIGTVVLKLRGERLWELVGEVKVGERGYAMLVDGNGVLIAHPREEMLYRSMAPFAAERIAQIDPDLTYSLPTIESADMPELLAPLTEASTMGTAAFTVAFGASDSATREAWVAGFARMGQRSWKVVVAEPRAQFAAGILDAVRQQAAVALVVACLAAAMALWRARGIVRPVVDLTDAAHRIAQGDFEARAPQRSEDEVGRLAAAFNAMVPQLQERVQLQQSLAVAMEVQQSLLPAADPTDAGLDIAGRSRYCDQTGGDYYDFIAVPRGDGPAVLIAVGDVMGHGIASALLMAAARAALRAQAPEQGDLAALMGKVNGVLAGNPRQSRFVTLALVEIDPRRGVARWASAGHDPTIVYHPRTDTFEEFEGGGIPLGIDSEFPFEEFSRNGLASGDVLVIGTDGVWEMRNEEGVMFTKERLREAMRAHAGETAAGMAAALEHRLAEFRGAEAPQDDVTFVVVKIR